MSRSLWIHAAGRAHWRSRRVRLWAVFLILAAGIMAFMPLLDYLGFGFALIMALLASAAGIDQAAALVRRAREGEKPAGISSVETSAAALAATVARAADLAEQSPRQVLSALWRRAALVTLGLLGPPLLIICINGLRVQNCDWLFGLQVFALMTVPSALAATTVGVLVTLAWRPRSRIGQRLAPALPLLILVGSVLYGVWRFYAAPPVFSYNMFAGYFPGNLYDEDVALHAPFYWARLAQLCMLATAWALAAVLLDVPTLRLRLVAPRPLALRWRAAALALVLGTGASVLQASGGVLGFSVDAGDIAYHLGGRRDTEHFVIYYPPGGEIERDIDHIAADHEFRYAQVVRALGMAPRQRITSFYFGSAEDKFRMMGARGVYMAKPWRHEIYVHHQGFPHEVLRHEIAHVVAAAFGSPVFRVSATTVLGLPLVFNVGLIEGTAVAADWPDHFTRELTPHQAVKAMRELGLAPPVDAVLSTGFLTFSSARSYTLAGSLVRYLLDTYGARPFHELYRSGGDFVRAYGKSRETVVREWEAMIDAVSLPPEMAEMVRERFRHQGIFQRPCPHAIARARMGAGERWARGDRAGAIALLRGVCDRAPEEPRYWLDLAGMLVGEGLDQEAETIYQRLAGDEETTSSTLRAQAYVDLVSMTARAGAWDQAIGLLDQAAALPLDSNLARNVTAQRFAATHPGPAAPALRDYFWGHAPAYGVDPMVLLGRAALATAAEPGLGLGHYLLGRNLRGRGAPADAAAALTRALDLGLPHPLLVREAARHLAEAAYLAGQPALVERAAGILMEPAQPRVVRLYGADWLERLHWQRTGTLPEALPGMDMLPADAPPGDAPAAP